MNKEEVVVFLQENKDRLTETIFEVLTSHTQLITDVTIDWDGTVTMSENISEAIIGWFDEQ